ncbi:hypothetical protein ACFYO1_13455 [Nocardia sp. NPDC006044]|uniref:hypothetical protein n=1 Tax=Nocardia sp. NPDC006044 TaxID=3364306 RepID=UPI00369704C2
MRNKELPGENTGNRYVRVALVIAAVLPLWLVDVTADAATTAFPDPNVTFLIQAEIRDGGTRCATQTDGKTAIKFTACDKGNESQQWFQREVDDQGYGMVYSVKGVCIDENAYATNADKCEKRAKPERLMWKQESGGLVRNKSDKPMYWSARGTSGDAGLTLTQKSSGASDFTIVSAD